MESGTKAEVMEKYCLLAYSACLLFMYFIIIFNLAVSSQYIGLAVLEFGDLSMCYLLSARIKAYIIKPGQLAFLFTQGWHHPQWAGPSHIINQENAP